MNEPATSEQSDLDLLIAKVTGSLGKEYEDAYYDLSSPNESFFLASMFFLNITPKHVNEKGEKRTVKVVVKRPSPFPGVREMLRSDAQFHNEILFYNQYARGHEDLPGCYYTDENPPVKSVIALENIEERGFTLSSWRYNVPMEYTVAAFQEMARFHAKGYVMKERSPTEFFDFVENIQETRYDNDPENGFGIITNMVTNRSIEYLRKHGHNKDFCDKMDVYLSNTYENVVLRCIKAEEPLVTLCHGDFTMNNIFFKKEGGEIRAMLIDFALIRYGSPIIDLSTFLCLHCAEEIGKDLIDSGLKAYNDSLIQCLTENGIKNLERFSYEAICNDYKEKGMFGFAIAAFFLATVMGRAEQTIEDMSNMDSIEAAIILRDLGGDEISDILAKMLLILQEYGCLDCAL
ncbi:uncharacterized protein LOC116428713 [Nomia melanderi]|uniref:uncharacterized protein LOC116428713 n=1 Tax=Nomia melanderi TaxID=2448451 RepID=UPI00130460A0|nr:uncharacterized protein LOC116428713 [Nomia melanderi]XP_031836577.1 uncharacterized protein LOC116428713 [Nomia melanderi]